MKPVCPFAGAARPDDGTLKKLSEYKQHPGIDAKSKTDSADSANSSPKCPLGYDKAADNKQHPGGDAKSKTDSADSGVISPKCPLGYDSQSFKIGPFSCMICQALLFQCSKCVPCSHLFCKVCISRFNDCPLCGADIESIEADTNLQSVVDRFIEGHARIKRQVDTEGKEIVGEKKTVIYEDVSLERGTFLVQQAMRAFRAKNVESAKSRLMLCSEDIREQLGRLGNTSELCSQLGAVLGMLGDCCRATGDASSAISYFEESVNFLSKVSADDLEITHTLSISLNKIGDLKYYAEDLKAARSYYLQALNVRRDALKHPSSVPSQILDVAVSLAKVADVDRNLGNENAAIDEFEEGIKLLESLKLNSEEVGLEQRRLSVLEFLNNQIAKKQSDATA